MLPIIAMNVIISRSEGSDALPEWAERSVLQIEDADAAGCFVQFLHKALKAVFAKVGGRFGEVNALIFARRDANAGDPSVALQHKGSGKALVAVLEIAHLHCAGILRDQVPSMVVAVNLHGHHCKGVQTDNSDIVLPERERGRIALMVAAKKAVVLCAAESGCFLRCNGGVLGCGLSTGAKAE